ncbi:MAG TPA: hypothetical protein VGH14_21905, partial [Solirubrobacterales bacterium]
MRSPAGGIAWSQPNGKGPATGDGGSEEAKASPALGEPFRFFSPTSFWNTPLAADAPLDPSSSGVVAQFLAEIAHER